MNIYVADIAKKQIYRCIEHGTVDAFTQFSWRLSQTLLGSGYDALYDNILTYSLFAHHTS